jgi:hypothetical protein
MTEKGLSTDEMAAASSRDGGPCDVVLRYLDGTMWGTGHGDYFVNYYIMTDTYIVLCHHGTREVVPFANIRSIQIFKGKEFE